MEPFTPPSPSPPDAPRRCCYCRLGDLGVRDLADLREKMGMNHAQLARTLFLSRRTVCRYEDSWRADGRHRCLPRPCLALLWLALLTAPFSHRVACAGVRLPIKPLPTWYPRRA